MNSEDGKCDHYAVTLLNKIPRLLFRNQVKFWTVRHKFENKAIHETENHQSSWWFVSYFSNSSNNLSLGRGLEK